MGGGTFLAYKLDSVACVSFQFHVPLYVDRLKCCLWQHCEVSMVLNLFPNNLRKYK